MAELPKVSLLIAAYNEEAVIEEKIKNCLELDYPRDKFEVIFASDGSTDNTNELIERHTGEGSNLVLYKFEKRAGKPSVLNKAVKQAKGDIIVFSDADTFLDKDALKMIVRPFADKKAGCVCGKIILKSAGQNIASEGVYWRYESWIKSMEAGLGSVSGAAGGLYAIRKNLWRDIPGDTLIDDFVISMKIAQKGYAVLYAPEALGYEETASTSAEEFVRRVRIGSGGYQSMILLAGILNPLKGSLSFRFWSHKVIRWLAPFLLIFLFISSVFLAKDGFFYLVVFTLQAVFYTAAILGGMLEAAGVNALMFSAAHHFAAMNAALFFGFFSYIFGLQKVTWRKAKKLSYRR